MKKPKKELDGGKTPYLSCPSGNRNQLHCRPSLNLFLSPFVHTESDWNFQGTKRLISNSCMKKSRIKEEDYTLTTFLHKSVYEQNMKTASPWIKEVHMHYQFPVTFKVNVVEHKVVAYYVTGGEDHYQYWKMEKSLRQ